jgi:tRNA/rRNA methyltransferase
MYVVLVEPQLPENIGAVARIMGNFGQVKLRLVNPVVSKDHPTAIATAVSSRGILEKSEVYPCLSDAIFDCRTVVGTSAHTRSLIKLYHNPKSFSEDFNKMPGPVALVFGAERTGLTTEQTALCNTIVQIPVDPDFSSLNLSHAVGILLYELFCANITVNSFWQHGDTQIAKTEEVNEFLNYLEIRLDQTHFWRTKEKKPGMRLNLFSFFRRQPMFKQDLKTLRGMIESLMEQKE